MAQTGTTIQGMVAAVDRVVHQISIATRAQSQGIGQFNEAVARRDAVTGQNATLVEQSAASASSREQRAQMLRRSVAVFKLD